jgi:DNA-binding response OmpR family regulator
MKNILLIEDNADIRHVTSEILQLANYQVTTAKNGKEGVKVALEKKPDLIICDIMMPGLDGYGVLHTLQKNESVRNTPFIFLTAMAEPENLRKGMTMGADDYLCKPFSSTELLNAIEVRLNKRDLLKQDLSPGLKGFDQLLSSSTLLEAENMLIENRDIELFRKKQLIYKEGNRPNKLLYVVSGKVRTFKRNDEGKELAVEIHHEGDFFGYTALFENCNYKESADALENSEIAMIPKEDFEQLLSSHPGVTHKFIKLLSHNMIEMEEHLLHLAYDSLRKKVADALLVLMRKYMPSPAGAYTFNISRENLATLAGTATESLIRTLGDFKDEKIIDIKDGYIIILNEKKLSNMVN